MTDEELRDKLASERGPEYDWKHEADHYRIECDKLRALLFKVEASGERDADERDQLRAEVENERLNRQGKESDLKIVVAERDQLRAEVERLKQENKTIHNQKGTACLEHDLVHYLACGHCVDNLRAEVERLQSEVTKAKVAVAVRTMAVQLDDIALERNQLRAKLEKAKAALQLAEEALESFDLSWMNEVSEDYKETKAALDVVSAALKKLGDI